MKTKFQITKNGVKIEEHNRLIDAILSIKDKVIDQSDYLIYTADNIPTAAIVKGREVSLTPLSLREVELKDGLYKIIK